MAFISKIAEHIIKEYSHNQEPLTIIFPNKRAALVLRKELSNKAQRNMWMPQIMSIQEIMSLWSGIQLIDNVDVIYELIKIMTRNGTEMSTRNNVFGLASQIVKDFDEIDQYAVDSGSILSLLADAKRIESLSKNKLTATEKAHIKFFESLYGYYNELRKKLLDENVGYYGLITRKLYETQEDELNKIIGKRKIIFAGFNAMTKTEEEIITRLVNAGKAVIMWDLDKYYYEDEKQEAGLFARQFFSKHENMKPDSIDDNFTDNDKEINIISVSGTTVQTNALQLKLKEEANDPRYKNEELKNKVVVLSDENLLIPTLNSIPEEYKNVFVTMGYPYSKTIVNQFIQHLFPFQNNISKEENKVYFWSLKRMLETELIKIIFNKEELSSISKYIDICVKKSIYHLTYNDLEEFFKDDNQEKIREFLRNLTKKWESTQDCIQTIKNLLILISNILPETKNFFIKNQISVAGRIFNKIEKLINKYDLIIQMTDVEMLYKQSAAEMSIRLESDTIKRNDSEMNLQIMGLLETRNLDFDVIHILSVNEGILPQSKHVNSLIPFDIRCEYKLPVYTNKQAVYAYHFYRLLQNAKTVNIYYNNLSDGMGESEPSRFIRQIISEIPLYNNKIKINEITYKAPLPKINKTIEIEVPKTDGILEKIRNRITGFDSKGRPKGLSPTSISCYLKCPVKFYLTYIENIRENNPTETIQSNVIGSIIHSTFEFLYKKFNNEKISRELYDAIVQKHLDEAFNEALAENNFKSGLPMTGFNYLSQIMIHKIINNFISYEKNFLKNNKIEIIGLEKKLFHQFDIDGQKVNMIGLADRIDRVGNTVRVIDYKSGSVKNTDVLIKEKCHEIADLQEKSLQLIIYKYLYKKMEKNINIEDIEPGIFGLLRVHDPFFPLINKSESFDDNNFMNTCDNMFEELFKELLNKDIPFYQVKEETKCKNCPFTNICKREPKSYY